MMRGSRSSSRCQDCGNQAKRDCAYMRCRTCCKGKGFECQTHIKSTWLPSSSSSSASASASYGGIGFGIVGRAQKQTLSLLHHNHHHHDLQLLPSSVHQQNPRWLSEIPSTGLDEEENMERNFPAEATFPAFLRRIRVSSMDDSINQFAYQTTVCIGGHVFKGILYDQGMESPTPNHFSAMAEPHQPNLSNPQYHNALIIGSSSNSCPNLPFSALVPPGMHFFQHSSSPPKSP